MPSRVATFVLLACLLACGCDDASSPRQPTKRPEPQSPASSVVSRAPGYKGPPLLERVVESTLGEGGHVVMARVLVHTLTTKDPIRILLHWENAGATARRLGTIDWQKTVESLSFEIAGPATPKTFHLKPPDAAVSFGTMPDLLLTLDERGVAAFGDETTFAWKDAVPSLTAGKHRITIKGQLAVAGEPLRFVTGPIDVEMRPPTADFKPLADLEAAAAAHVLATLRQKSDKPAKQTLEDVQGNRVVRFAVRLTPARYEMLFVEVVVSRAGKALGLSQEKIHTCIAKGTLVETPNGSTPIEALGPGDMVWSFDVERAARRVARVVDRVAIGERDVIELAPGLRVTPEHPVWAGDAWRRAGEVKSGTRLLAMRGPTEATPRPGDREMVYDLAVESPHTFFAAGVLVHNKAGVSSGARRMRVDDWQTLSARPQ